MPVDFLRRRSLGLDRSAAHRERLLCLGELALKLTALLDEGGHTLRDFIRRGLQDRRSLAQLGFALAQPPPRRLARQRFDSADARRYRAFRDDLEQLDVAERTHVRTAAQLDRIIVLVELPHR